MEQLNQLMLVWEEVLNIMAADLPERSFDAWLKTAGSVPRWQYFICRVSQRVH